ncbi:MAG: exosome protein [Methanomassiliicoccaceae archaeon]|jgi:RNA binding exosome subunit|nr:exosome protein [Methanomassiliicoccaceae archaeon]
MAGVFHWVKVRLFCYATEDQEKLHDLMVSITGTEDFDAEMSDGHHGNSMIILSSELKGNAECTELFKRLGKDVIDRLLDDLDKRIDEDCTFYMRLDKQAAVLERYEIAHHGDVVSITCKIVSHPARKEIADKNMRKFLDDIRGSL